MSEMDWFMTRRISSAGRIVYFSSTISRFLSVIVHVLSFLGLVSVLAGSVTGFLDGIGTSAKFSNLRGIAVDNYGNLFLADRGNFVVRKVTPAGTVIYVLLVATYSTFNAVFVCQVL